MRLGWHGSVLVLVLSVVLRPAAAVAAQQWRGSKGEVSWVVVHKFHEVVGTSSQLDVRAMIDGTTLKVAGQAPTISFSSGNANRDAHVMEVVAAAQFPVVLLKAVATSFVPPKVGRSLSLEMQGEVTLKGEKTRVPVMAVAKRTKETEVEVELNFEDSLTAHKVERPSLLFVAVDDAFKVTAHVLLVRSDL